MSVPPGEAPLAPDAPARLVVGRFQLDLPEGAIPRPVRVRLDEVAPPPLSPDHHLRAAFRLTVVDSRPAPSEPSELIPQFRFAQPGVLSFSYAGLEDADLPETTLQVRWRAAKHRLWLELPAQFDRQAKTVSLPIWNEGHYALVANAGLAPRAPVEATIGPAGGSLDFARLHLEFSPGCFSEETRVTVGLSPDLPWQGGLPFLFEITAERLSDGQEVSQLGASLRLQASYADAEVGSLPRNRLGFRHYDEASGSWQALPSTVDTAAHTIHAETTHLSGYGVGPSVDEAPLDFGSNWLRVDDFTGAVSFAMPFELPPGPGGLVPDLKLTYNSQSSHWAQRANYLSEACFGKGAQSASWVGEGFDISIGYIQKHVYNDGTEHYSGNIFGQGFKIEQDSGGVWHTTDEQFWKVSRGGTENNVPYTWRVIKPDGSKYYFGIHAAGFGRPDTDPIPSNDSDVMVYYDYVASTQKGNRWMLSRVEDTHGNLIRVDYKRLTKNLYCNGSASMTPAVYPERLQYGGGTWGSLPVEVVFNRSGQPVDVINDYPSDPNNRYKGVDRLDTWNEARDFIWDGCTQQSFDIKFLDSLDVKVGGTLVRRYKFTVANWNGTIANCVPLMLADVSLWSDASGSARQNLLTLSFDPLITDANDPGPNGQRVSRDYRLLRSLVTGFGATNTFDYQAEDVSQFSARYGPSNTLVEGRAFVVTNATTNPGFGGTSMVATRSSYTSPLGNNNPDAPAFLGHSSTTVVQAGYPTVSYFHQRDEHQQDEWAGRPSQVDYKDASGNIVKSVVNTWSLEATSNISNFVRLDAVEVKLLRGDRLNWDRKKTTYNYDLSLQGNVQRGNQTHVFEYDLNVSQTDWIRQTKRWFYPTDVVDANQVAHYLVNKLAQEAVYKWPGTSSDLVRKTAYCYDNSSWQHSPIGSGQYGDDGSYRGRLTALRRGDGGDSVDVRYGYLSGGQWQDGYDVYGNVIATTEFGAYGVWGQSPGTTALATGDPRTTRFEYDPTYHAYKTRETNPLTPLNHITDFDYDYTRGRLTKVTIPYRTGESNPPATRHSYDPLGRRTATWLPGDVYDPSNPGTASLTYRYLLPRIGGATVYGPPTTVQTGRRKDAGGGSWGRRAYEWRCYDGLGRLIQSQADFERSSQLIRAADVTELRTRLTSYLPGRTWTDNPLTTTTLVKAKHYAELQTAVQELWSAAGLGPLPGWSSGVTPGGPSLGTAATPIFGSDLADLRRWLNQYEASQGLGLGVWSNAAGSVVVVNRRYDSRGLLAREMQPYVRAVTTPGYFLSGSADWGDDGKPATRYSYDELGRPRITTLPDGTTTEVRYDGRSYARDDENDHSKRYDVDALGRVTAVTERTGTGTQADPYQTYAVTAYEYDVADQLRTVTDHLNNQTTIEYDGFGRKRHLYDPDLGHWQYDYDPIGTLQRQTDAKAQVLWFEYDLLKRLVRRRRDGQTGTVLAEFVYDEVASGYSNVGRRTTARFGSGLASQVKSYYDARGRVVKADYTLESVPYSVQTTYDALDRVLTVTHPNLEVVRYTYGDHGFPVRLESSLRGVIVGSALYNPLGKLSDLTLGNGQVVSYRYWGLDYQPVGNPNQHYGLLRSVVTGSLQNLTYDYDAVGNVKSITEASSRLNETLSFSYDHLDRLVGVSGAYGRSYSYDQLGRLTSFEGTLYSYPTSPANVRPHGPITVGGSGYTYDANGNLIGAESRVYSYDVENRLTQVSGAGLPTRGFEYDGDGALWKLSEDGSAKRRYVTADYQVELPSGEPVLYYRFGGRAVAWRNDSVLRYLLADHLSSTHAEVSETQGEAGQRRHYSFGSDRAVPGAADLTREERYTGQRRAEAGGGSARRELYHYGARFYLPGVGIFTQPDTVVPEPQNPQSLNRYSYVLNNPLKYVDNSGRFPIPWDLGDYTKYGWIGAAAYAAVYGYTALNVMAAVAQPVRDPRVTVANPITSADMTDWLIRQINIASSEPVTKEMRAGFSNRSLAGQSEAIVTWTSLVAPRGRWDFKGDILAELGIKTITLGGRQTNYQAVANAFYGYLGRATGQTAADLLLAGGIAQIIGRSPTGGADTFFDDPFDSWWIRFGTYLYDLYGDELDGLTPDAFSSALDEFLRRHGKPPPPLDEG